MWSPSTLAALLIVLVPLDAFPSSEFARQYLFGQNYDCGLNGDCEISSRQSRGGGMFDSLTAGGTFGLAKRLEPLRLANREDSFAKRRGALDSLVAGGMFGKAAKRSDYEYDLSDNGKNLEKFQRNVRPLNTMELGGSFGRAVKRYSLDTLGNNAFGVEKRKAANGNTDEELKAFLNKSFENENNHRQHADTSYRTPGYYSKIIPSYTSSYSEPKYDQLTQ
ncbi:hypothetical protein ILUMI_22352 [Ignelater luminosus]|uniref:Uncharacterized protein n=1 Tax=Ignelater luminosus TaxID=2038154 RepID=A0A8K0CE12_IGNLU|nr:hypothetical protein ILUMI_22352 [Ignelater luminosus]